MTWAKILKMAGIPLTAIVSGGIVYLAATQSDMDAALTQIVTVQDSLVPAHYDHFTRDSTGDDTTYQIPDSVLVEARWLPLQMPGTSDVGICVNDDSLYTVTGDTIIIPVIVKRNGKPVVVRGVRYPCTLPAGLMRVWTAKLDGFVDTDRR